MNRAANIGCPHVHELGHRSGVGWAIGAMSVRQPRADTARDPAIVVRFNKPMQYLPLFLLFLAVLIAAYFYLERAKKRDGDKALSTVIGTPTSTPTSTEPASPPVDRVD